MSATDKTEQNSRRYCPVSAHEKGASGGAPSHAPAGGWAPKAWSTSVSACSAP